MCLPQENCCMLKPLLILASVLLLLPNIPGIQLKTSTTSYNGKEKFNPELSYINSVDKLEKYVDAAAKDKNIAFTSLEYAEILDNAIALRFYKGQSNKTLQQNWITVVADKLAGTNYSMLLSADDILQYPNAAVMQQNLVMMELLKRKNIEYRNISLNEKDALEIKSGSNWYFFDVSNEPNIKAEERISGNHGIYASNLSGYYGPASHAAFGNGLINIKRGNVNDSAIASIQAVQIFTTILSKTAWIFSLLMLWAVRKRPFKLYAIKPKGKYIQMFPMQPLYNA